MEKFIPFEKLSKRKQRELNAQKRGSIDFDLPEAKIILDENDFPIEIKEYEIGISNRIIEQFMLITNQTVASHMLKNSLPSTTTVPACVVRRKTNTQACSAIII